MGMIEFEESAIQVDATIVGEGLGIEPSLLQAHMREGNDFKGGSKARCSSPVSASEEELPIVCSSKYNH